MMTGEKLAWYTLASHLHMSKQRCQFETSSSEFVDWMVYLEQDVNAFHREDYYWAQIALEIRKVFAWGKSKRHWQIKDLLILFKENAPEVREDRVKRTSSVKSYFFNLLGMRGQKKKG